MVIGDNVWVTVVEITTAGVRLGFEAPPDVRIDREEVHEDRRRFGPRHKLHRPKRLAG